MKPFIHPFANRMGYFFFDVNKNKVVELSKERYDLLIRCITIGDYSKLWKDKYFIKLKEKGYLSENRPDQIRHPYSDCFPCFLSSHLHDLVLQVTRNCNMKCRYCPFSGDGTMNRQHQKYSMNWGTAKASIDFVYERSKNSKVMQIGFYGGEPLLEYDLIEQTVEYCKKLFYNKELIFTITTNGTILNPQIIDFLADNKFRLVISVDGPEAVHDRNRRFAKDGRGTFLYVYENIVRIRDQRKDLYDNILISAVVEPDSDPRSYVGFFESDPVFQPLSVMFNNVSDEYIQDVYARSEEYELYEKTKEFREILSEFIGIERIDGKSKLEELQQAYTELGPVPRCTHHGGVCVPGYAKTFVDIFGDIRPCEKVSEKSEAMVIGNVNKGFYSEKIYRLLNIGLLTGDECKNCWMIRHCRECAQMIDQVDTLSFEKKRGVCFTRRQQMEEELNDYVYYSKLLSLR